MDPVEFHLREVDRVLGSKRQVGEPVCAALVPGICRLALEARLTELIINRELENRTHAEVRELLDGLSTVELFGTWIFDKPSEGKRVGGYLAQRDPDLEKAAVVICRGAHVGSDSDPAWVLASTRRILDEVLA
ncbi:MAG: hypothetical protein GY884_31670 [Proteobacteria bacterium]|nr:hypothetical protein [Pseudomonadota bacterium]